jgi:TonB-linked SusC/RagA family outer membrane protein
MKNLLKLCLASAFIFSGVLNAQQISGSVSDDTGPLPGASVVVEGTTTGTTTDFDGNFTIDASSSAVLIFSYVGYQSQTVSLNGRTSLSIVLQEDTALLDEVVLIGYGTTTVDDATGAVTSISAEDFNQGIIATPEQLIQGRTAGVQISSTTGEPGSGIQVRIRGTNSVRSNNNPLFVVDGVPLSGGSTSLGDVPDLGTGSQQPKNPLAFLNPNDIASISILKDASAAAIYGARGANGVVIIETKSGRGGEGKYEFSSTVNFSSPAGSYDLLSPSEFRSAVTQFGGDLSAVDGGASTDWWDYVTRNTVSTENNLSFSNSLDKGSYRVSVGYADQQGILEKSELQRLTYRLNAEYDLTDRLNLNLSATMSTFDDTAPPVSGSAGYRGDFLGGALSANPTWPIDENYDTGALINPANMIKHMRTFSENETLLANLTSTYKLSDALSAKLTLGLERSETQRNTMASKLAAGSTGGGILNNGRGVVQDLENEQDLVELTLNYNKDFGDNNLDVVAGYSYQKTSTDGRYGIGWGFAQSDLIGMSKELSNNINIIESSLSGSYQQFGFDGDGLFVNRLFPTISSNEAAGSPSGVTLRAVAADYFGNTSELQSYFARVNYSIMDKYLITATVRADGSSSFGNENQYGIFPSAAVAWKIHEDLNIDGIDNLKLRVGYGITGNQQGLGYGNFLRRERFGGIGIDDGGNINMPGTFVTSFANPDLKWEETTSSGIGLDFAFDNFRLTGSVDVYKKETDGLLLSIPAAQPSPQPFFFKNLDATVLNQGVEVALNYQLVRGSEWNWEIGFNAAYNENEVQDFGGLIEAARIYGQGLSGAFAQMLAGGRPLFSYFLRDFQGFDSAGQPIGDTQQFVDKSALPDLTGGLSTSISKGNWNFNMYFSGMFGHYIYNNTENALFTAGAIANARNVTKNVITAGESGTAEAAVSTRFLESGDFIRLQSASLGYNVPLNQDSMFDTMRIFLNGQNLLLFTDYTGLDPEVSSTPGAGALLSGIPTAGIDWAAYPKPRTVSLGINVKF